MPAAPSVASPTRMSTPPLFADAWPEATAIQPDECAVESPVFTSTAPLASGLAGVLMLTAPLVSTKPIPLRRWIAPPVPSLPEPPVTVMLPPSPPSPP
ncbi:MAG: hypothetical protein VX747_13995, partial [Actinomycetota bacterium]|nr:hypothetical protein [Actinomycetota bacterium]